MAPKNANPSQSLIPDLHRLNEVVLTTLNLHERPLDPRAAEDTGFGDIILTMVVRPLMVKQDQDLLQGAEGDFIFEVFLVLKDRRC